MLCKGDRLVCFKINKNRIIMVKSSLSRLTSLILCLRLRLRMSCGVRAAASLLRASLLLRLVGLLLIALVALETRQLK